MTKEQGFETGVGVAVALAYNENYRHIWDNIVGRFISSDAPEVTVPWIVLTAGAYVLGERVAAPAIGGLVRLIPSIDFLKKPAGTE